MLEWAFLLAAVGLGLVMAGVVGAFGAVTFSATVAQQAGQGFSVGVFAGLGLLAVLLRTRKG